VDALKDLENTAQGDALSGFSFLIRQGFITLHQFRAQAVFGQGIDEETQPHNHEQGHDTGRLLEEQAVGEEERVFEEAKASLDSEVLACVEGRPLVKGKVVAIRERTPYARAIRLGYQVHHGG
jgi:hypothetical protein